LTKTVYAVHVHSIRSKY